MLFPVPPVREGGRDVANSGEGAREGEPEDGNQDLNLSRIVHLDGKQGNFSSGQACWLQSVLLETWSTHGR